MFFPQREKILGNEFSSSSSSSECCVDNHIIVFSVYQCWWHHFQELSCTYRSC